MSTLPEWFAARDLILRLYREELHRDILADPDALANWLYHWREDGYDEAGMRAAIRDSDEWRAAHPGGTSGVPPVAAPPPPVPMPHAGRVIRVTDEQDDVLVNRIYSYWPNAWISGDSGYVFVGHIDGRSRVFRVDLRTGTSTRALGLSLPYRGTTEGWYWDAQGWIYLTDGPRLRHVNPFTGADQIVVDITDTHPGCDLWQAHSSDDGQTHSATVRRVVDEGRYPYLGTLVSCHGHQQFWDAWGALDESQVTPDGAWLIIKEDDCNRIVELETGYTRFISDAEGAVGHSDCGPGFVIGEWSTGWNVFPSRGECVRWDLQPWRMRTLFQTWNLGHVSVRGGRCLRSNETQLSLIDMESGVETPLVAHGMVVIDPARPDDFQVRANLDPTGRVACYLSNVTGWMELYLLVLDA